MALKRPRRGIHHWGKLSEEHALPCPFCGAQPFIKAWHGGGPMKRAVTCNNFDGGCLALPLVTGATRRAALEAWNTRGGQPRRGQG